jgi:hypothetical protein
MPTPTDKKLYKQIKKQVYDEIPKHSLYRSAQLVKRYKEAGGTYKGPENTKDGIKNWMKADWISVNDYYHTGEFVKCGNTDTQAKFGEYPLCRPREIVEKMSRVEIKKLIDAKNKAKGKPVRTSKVLGTDKYNITNKHT